MVLPLQVYILAAQKAKGCLNNVNTIVDSLSNLRNASNTRNVSVLNADSIGSTVAQFEHVKHLLKLLPTRNNIN